MRIVNRGMIYNARSAPPEARFATFPAPARLEDGTLVSSFRIGSSKDSADEDSRVMTSDDEGATWQTAFPGFGDVPPGRGRIRCLGVTAAPEGELLGALGWIDRSDPSLPLFNPKTEGILPTRMLFAASRDRRRSWTRARELSLLPHTGNALTGYILVLRDGALALP